MPELIQGPLKALKTIASAIFLVALVAIWIAGDFSFAASVFLAVLVAGVVALVLYLGFVGPSMATAAAAPAVSKPAAAPVDAAPEPAPEPVAASGDKPAGLDGPRNGNADDLKQIKGVGPKMEQLLNSMGYFHFDQIGSWSESDVAWVDENLEGFKGRVTRDNWVTQAKALAGGNGN